MDSRDWAALRRRVSDARAAGEDSADDDTRRATLDARARELARPATGEAEMLAAAGAGEVLVFRRAGESFGMPLSAVVEVARSAVVTPLGAVPAPVVGVTGWRGQVLTVIDLAAGREAPPGAPLLVLGERRAELALVVDEVEDVRLVDESGLSPGAGLAPGRAALVRGVTTEALAVLDADALFRQAGD